MSTTLNSSTQTLASSLAYQPFGPMDSMTYGNSLSHSRDFDLDYRLTDLTTGTVQDLSYTLNAANNITAITNSLDSNRNQSFVYDDLNRLTEAQGIYGIHSYSYDANGNRLTSVIDAHVQTYSYATNSHRLLQTQNGGTQEYGYDANGNTTDNTDRQFTYGNNNRLKEAQIANTPVATYIYNGKGERVQKQSTDTTFYYYDQSGQLIAELDGFGNTLREYLYVDGQPLAYVTLGAVNFIHTDHLGTPQLITDSNQNIVWSADYTPFGEATVDPNSTITNNLRFPGQYYDQETGLHYNYMRDYSPEIGRYLQSDLIGLAGGLNTYLYALNPLTQIDPFGLMGQAPGGVGPRPPGQGLGFDDITGPFGPVCGTGAGAYFIPDGYFTADFQTACQAHDDCYSTCGIAKGDCDAKFVKDLRRACGSGFNFTCVFIAQFYFSIVRDFGGDPYRRAQEVACASGSCPK